MLPAWSEWRGAWSAFLWVGLSALLMRLTMAPLHWGWVAPLAMVPLFWGLRRCRPAMAFWVGWFWGTIHSFWWIGWLTVVSRFNPFVYLGIVPGSMLLGLHAGVVLGLIVMAARRLPPWAALGAGMMLWGGMDFFRMVGRLGIPFGIPGQSLLGWLPVAHGASIGGLPLLGALLAGFGLAGMEVIAAFRGRYGHAGAITRLGLVMALFVALHVHGARRIAGIEARLEEANDPLRIALVQTGIDQEVKFASYASEDAAERQQLQDQMFVDLLALLDTIEPGTVDLVVTPESSLTHELVDVEEAVQRRFFGGVPLLELTERATHLEASMVVGGVDNVFRTADGELTEFAMEGVDDHGTFLPGMDVYGAMWLLRPGEDEVRMAADYRKVRLMPFGEEVPYLDIIPGFQEHIVQVGTFAKGRLGGPLVVRMDRGYAEEPLDVAFGPSICFEDQFPYIHRHWALGGARLFVNTTNDAWFDGSIGPELHMHSARWRSIETGLPMVRATNTGLTVVIDGAGRVVEQFPPGERGVHIVALGVPRRVVHSIYTRYGDWFGWLCLLGSVVLVTRLMRTREDTE